MHTDKNIVAYIKELVLVGKISWLGYSQKQVALHRLWANNRHSLYVTKIQDYMLCYLISEH